MDLPDWGRTWILQEVLLARDPQVLLGTTFVQLSRLAGLSLCTRTGRQRDDRPGRCNLLSLWTLKRSSPGLDFDLLSCMRLSPETKCSVRHDYIYGVMGICPDFIPLHVGQIARISERHVSTRGWQRTSNILSIFGLLIACHENLG